MLAPAGPDRAGQALPDCNPQQRPLPVGIIRAYTAHVHAADRGGSPGECRAFVPTRLYHPALAGTPPEEGNWNYFGLAGASPEEGNWNYLGGLFPTRLYHGSAELAERPTSL